MKNTIKREQRQTRFVLPGMNNLRDAGANAKKLFMAVAACAMMLTGCAKEGTDGGLQADGTISAIRVSTDGFFNADGADSRAADDGYYTTFVSGDKIGLTVVRDGTILHDNIQLSYTSGAWALPTDAELWYYAGATYIAYYPYSSTMTGMKSADEIVEAFSPKQNQADYVDYTASDLMMWSGEASGTTTAPILDISLAHAMALVIVEPRGAGYTAPEGAAWVWHDEAGYNAPSDVRITVTVGGTEYTPYAMLEGGNTTAAGETDSASDGTYRILVKPTVSANIAVSYETHDIVVEWTATKTTPTAAKYIKYNVNPPATLHSGVLGAAVGDYFFYGAGPDGEHVLLPGDYTLTDALKAECDGVVAKTDGTAGKVMHKEMGRNLKWDEQFIATGATSMTDGKYNTDIITALDSYRASPMHPAGAPTPFEAFRWCVGKGEGWYLPAIEELTALGSVSSILHTALWVAGGTIPVAADVYWSSTEAGDLFALATDSSFSSMITHGKNMGLHVRAFIAF